MDIPPSKMSNYEILTSLAKEIGEERVISMAESFLAAQRKDASPKEANGSPKSQEHALTTPPRVKRILSIPPLRLSRRLEELPPLMKNIIPPTLEEFSKMPNGNKFFWLCMQCHQPAVKDSALPGKFCTPKCYDSSIRQMM